MSTAIKRLVRGLISYVIGYVFAEYQGNDIFIIIAPVIQTIGKALREAGKKYNWKWTEYLPV